MKLFTSAKLCAAACSLFFFSAAFAQSTSIYVDPQQHFTLQVQSEWLARSFDSGSASGVTIAHGADAYAQVLVQKGIDPATFLKALNDNMQSTHPGYHIQDRGSRTLANQPSSFITAASQDASGTHKTQVYLATFAANGYTYAAIVSSSGADAQDDRMTENFNLARGMIDSLSLGTASVPTPSPARSRDPKPNPAAQPEPVSNSWTTHSDPAGFAVDLPAAWTVTKDPATGRIVLHGTRREQVVIWPLFLQQGALDARSAATLLQQLARTVDAQMPWGTAQPMQNVERVIATSGQRSGSAMLSWANGAGGTSVYLYCVEAPTDVYRTSTEAFVGILKSFHIVQDPSIKNLPGPAAGSGGGALSFVTWNDPQEGAFSVAVPQGWQVTGGTYRLSPLDVRYALAMGSPDGQVRATIGDSSIGVFTQPTQMLAMGGLREGSYQALGDGSRLEIRRYMPGPQFARSYVERVVSRQCSGLEISSNNVRQDLASTFLQSARNEGAGRGSLTAGDVTFTCNMNGNPVQGKYTAATLQPMPGNPMWFVYRLYGYLVHPGREQEAGKVVTQALQSWKFSPQWEAQQRNTANAVVQQDNIRSQQIRARAQAAIAENQRETSDIITKGWEQRQKVYDEVSRRRENAILGTLDVVDPQTGAQYKVSNYGDYHYMSNDGYIYSTNSPNSPGPNLREMITLPY